MTPFLKLAVFLLLFGTLMILGPLWRIHQYEAKMKQMSPEDLLDHEVRYEGTFLFIAGGIFFVIAALVIAGLSVFKGGGV